VRRLAARAAGVGLAAVLLAGPARGAEPSRRTPVILDTDFQLASPSDDALALLLALQSPELDVVGITTVAGNASMARATADVLRALEIVGRADIPVYRGAARPLAHVAGEWERPDTAGGGRMTPRNPGAATRRSRPRPEPPPTSWRGR
jgi:inosine-uridine nucleoside N-ribohydrolase